MSFLILTQFPGLAVGNCRRACVSPGCCLGIFQPVGTFGCCKDTSFSVHFQAWSRFCGIGRCIFWFPEGRRRHSRGCPYSVPAPDLYRSLPLYRPVCHAFRAASVSRYLVFPDFPTCWEIFFNVLGICRRRDNGHWKSPGTCGGEAPFSSVTAVLSSLTQSFGLPFICLPAIVCDRQGVCRCVKYLGSRVQ